MPGEVRILNLGAGVQSTTLYLMALSRELRFDAAIFADTQEEPELVYRHLEWLKSLGGPPILVRSTGSLGNDLIRGRNSTNHRFASIPFHILGHDGRSGMGRRQCTREYKVEVIEKTIRREILGLKPRQRPPKGLRACQIYGISMDEAGRSVRIRERLKKSSLFVPEFPLIERRMTRADCVAWLNRFGVPHEVPKSSCVFCPYHSNAHWRWLRDNDPAGWARAVEIDEALRSGRVVASLGLRGLPYVHRSCMPLATADLGLAESEDPRQIHLPLSWTTECTGMCGV